MKYIGILLWACVLVGAGGAGGFFYFKNSAVASFGEVNQQAIADKEAKELSAKEAEEAAKNLRFVELTPIILPIMDAQGVSQVVTLIVSLEVTNEENEKFAQALSPRLKDAYIQDMYGVLNRKASMEGGVIKVDQLKERLNRIASQVLGEDKVNGVLLQVVNQRPI